MELFAREDDCSFLVCSSCDWPPWSVEKTVELTLKTWRELNSNPKLSGGLSAAS